jgi:uncharacterized membrane protein
MSEQSRENPPASRVGWTDEQVEQVIGNLLRYGVIASALVVLIGGLIFLAQDALLPTPDYKDFQEEPFALRGPQRILLDAAALHSRGLIMLGLLMLIATPVARVLFSVFAFARQRDTTYVLVTLVVLAVLLYSLFSGYFS